MVKQKSLSFPLQLVVLALARLFLNTGLRLVYPFAPALARGLGVELTSIYNLITLRNFAGLLSPLFGPLSEWRGRRPIMISALLLFSLSCMLLIFWPTYWLLGITLFLIALAKVVFDPAMQAYVAESVPYSRRGMAFAIIEFSWAGALIIGAPAVGFIIQYQGWRAPFLWLGLLGLGATILVWNSIPTRSNPHRRVTILPEMFRLIRRHPVIWAASIYTLFAMGANEIFFIVYGDWMEGSYQLHLTSLGLASGIIGSAEISGELFAGWSVDRFGKRPVVIITGLLNAVFYLVIPYTSVDLFSALASLFILFLFFEVTVVGAVPLLSEIVPKARSAVMAIIVASSALGRALGDLVGPRIWQKGGVHANGMAAAVIMGLAVFILARWVKEDSS